MAEPQIRYEDGGAYERSMGQWSRRVGAAFLDWLAPRPGLRWIDIGCGTGAFTELIVERSAPAAVEGIDPSDAQLAFARARETTRMATFRAANAMALPFADDSFDAAVMALVIFFVSDPAKGVAEMARLVAPGGTVATYAWDMLGGGFPMHPIRAEMAGMGIALPLPPNSGASRAAALWDLWTGARLEAIAAREIAVERTFPDFDAFWDASRLSASIRPTLAAMAPDAVEELKRRVRAGLPADAEGRVTVTARANAIKGRVPK
jgi:SAM-dependent methyltransferase